MSKNFAIVVIYNGMQRNWIYSCFSSINKSNVPVQIIAVDNFSTDGSRAFIKKNFPDSILIELSQNFGYAKAVNAGLKEALKLAGDYFLLLNQDVQIEDATFKELVKYMEDNTEFGILSPMHLNGAGNDLDKNFYEATIKKTEGNLWLDKKNSKGILPVIEVKYVNAACWLLSKKCVEQVGFFDDVLFRHYGEDDNYLQRVLYHRFKIGIATNCFIYHDREYRKGEKTRSSFTQRKALAMNNFFVQTADINKEKFRTEFARQLKYSLANSAKHFFQFQVNEGLFYLKLGFSMCCSANKIKRQRKKY